MPKVFCSIAMSLDGFIASKDGNLDWLNKSMAKGEDYGFMETMNRTGAYIMGANSYKEMTQSGMISSNDPTPTYVISHDKDLNIGKSVTLYSGDLGELIAQIKTEKDIYVFGGGEVITQFIDQNLLDELILAIVPVLLGEGVPLFRKIGELKKLKVTKSKVFDSGIILMNYQLK